MCPQFRVRARAAAFSSCRRAEKGGRAMPPQTFNARTTPPQSISLAMPRRCCDVALIRAVNVLSTRNVTTARRLDPCGVGCRPSSRRSGRRQPGPPGQRPVAEIGQASVALLGDALATTAAQDCGGADARAVRSPTARLGFRAPIMSWRSTCSKLLRQATAKASGPAQRRTH
jgi:hypothetical protein